jgi:DNA polymerase-3 subunit gamma/tau
VTVASASAALAAPVPAPVSVLVASAQAVVDAVRQPEHAHAAVTRVIPPWESEQEEAVESLESLELDEDFMDNPAEYVATHSHGQSVSMLSAASSSLPPHLDPDIAAPAGFSVSAPVQSGMLILPEPWESFSAKLPLSGLASQLARQSECTDVSGRVLTLRVPTKALTQGPHADRLRTVLTEYFGFPVQVQYAIGAVQGQSAHTMDLAAQIVRQEQAELTIHNDPFVQALVRDFGAQVVPGSVSPTQIIPLNF